MASRSIRLFAWVLLLVLGGFLATASVRFLREQRESRGRAFAAARAQADGAAGEVEELLTSMERQAHGIALDLETGRLGRAGLQARLRDSLERSHGDVSRVGVLFQPGAAGPGRRLLGPYAERKSGGIRAFDYAATGDYTTLPWYPAELERPLWCEPHKDPATGNLQVDYSEPVHLPGTAGVAGVVRIEVALKDIQDLVASVVPSSTGYAFLLSAAGVYIADPILARVRHGETMEAVGRDLRDGGRLRIARAAAEHHAGFAESVSPVTGQRAWIFLAPVPAARWSLGTVVLNDELDHAPPGLKREILKLVSLAVLTGTVALFLLLGLPSGDAWRHWGLALGASLLLAGGTGVLWHFAYTLHQEAEGGEVEIKSKAVLKAFLKNYERLGSGLGEVDSVFVPTGVFIQKMELNGEGSIKISGQVWEKFPKGLPVEARGVTFPEAVSCEIGLGISDPLGDSEVRVYPFRGVFTLPAGSTRNYPFDQATVKLRIWPRLINSNAVPVPDLDAYTVLAPASLPGIDKGLSVPGWHLDHSHFSFFLQTYNTNFGLPDFNGLEDSPELVYSFTLKRNFTNPFIATFLPIFVVASLLFALVLVTTVAKEQASAFGYNVINILRALASLFFPAVIAQVNLRSRILTSGVLNVEYCYFVLYGLILLAAVNSLSLAFWEGGIHRRHDNRLPKLLFWPLLCAAFYVISTRYLA